MKCSVLMSVYAKEKPEYLKAALESILNQTLKADEILIIKDGPLPKELEEVIESVSKDCSYLRTYQFEENVQLGRALKKGVELCENDLIARMDTDDIAYPDRLQQQYEYMLGHKEVAVLGGYIEEFSEDNLSFKLKTESGKWKTIGQI